MHPTNKNWQVQNIPQFKVVLELPEPLVNFVERACQRRLCTPDAFLREILLRAWEEDPNEIAELTRLRLGAAMNIDPRTGEALGAPAPGVAAGGLGAPVKRKRGRPPKNRPPEATGTPLAAQAAPARVLAGLATLPPPEPPTEPARPSPFLASIPAPDDLGNFPPPNDGDLVTAEQAGETTSGVYDRAEVGLSALRKWLDRDNNVGRPVTIHQLFAELEELTKDWPGLIWISAQAMITWLMLNGRRRTVLDHLRFEVETHEDRTKLYRFYRT
jgi:hypothetical protein